jgi:hypothetical protein
MARHSNRKKSQLRLKKTDAMAKKPDPSTIAFKDVIQEFPSKPPRLTRGFASLPQDIALCIFDELKDPIDRVCFAMISKSLWSLLRGKLRLEQFEVPSILPPRVTLQRGIISRWPFFGSMRWRLLEKIEDNYWRCCAGCLRLHPKREFFSSELVNPSRDRYCRTPGLIQMCPHLYLTYKKCMSLQKALLDAPPESNNVKVGDIAINDTLRHECELFAGGMKAVLSMQPFLSPHFKQLIFHNEYTVKNFPSGKLKESLEKFGDNIFLPCPHRSILAHCQDMTRGGEWDTTMVEGHSKNTGQAMCISCDTQYFKFQKFTHSISRKQMHGFVAHRFVGDYWGYGECKVVGRGNPDRLQAWINRTNLANVLKVDFIYEKCKTCRGKEGRYCAKLNFLRLTCPSWKASVPGMTWKNR